MKLQLHHQLQVQRNFLQLLQELQQELQRAQQRVAELEPQLQQSQQLLQLQHATGLPPLPTSAMSPSKQRSSTAGPLRTSSTDSSQDPEELNIKVKALSREKSLLQQQLQQQGDSELKQRIKDLEAEHTQLLEEVQQIEQLKKDCALASRAKKKAAEKNELMGMLMKEKERQHKTQLGQMKAKHDKMCVDRDKSTLVLEEVIGKLCIQLVFVQNTHADTHVEAHTDTHYPAPVEGQEPLQPQTLQYGQTVIDKEKEKVGLLRQLEQLQFLIEETSASESLRRMLRQLEASLQALGTACPATAALTRSISTTTISTCSELSIPDSVENEELKQLQQHVLV